MKDIGWFLSICNLNGLQLNTDQAERFERFRGLLLAANRDLNLISRKDEENFYSRHVLNSISFLFTRQMKKDAVILDLGTGGGLPGIPLKIIYPSLKLTLLDSISKKTVAVARIVEELSLSETTVKRGRAEEIARTREYIHHFDYVISRGAGKLAEVAKWSRFFPHAFASLGQNEIAEGLLVVLKGGEFLNELKHLRNLPFVESVEVSDIIFRGMDETDNVDKKIVLISYKSDGF